MSALFLEAIVSTNFLAAARCLHSCRRALQLECHSAKGGVPWLDESGLGLKLCTQPHKYTSTEAACGPSGPLQTSSSLLGLMRSTWTNRGNQEGLRCSSHLQNQVGSWGQQYSCARAQHSLQQQMTHNATLAAAVDHGRQQRLLTTHGVTKLLSTCPPHLAPVRGLCHAFLRG